MLKDDAATVAAEARFAMEPSFRSALPYEYVEDGSLSLLTRSHPILEISILG